MAAWRQEMIDTTLGNSQLSKNYILKNQIINSLSYKENDRHLQQGNFRFTTDQVSLTYKTELVTIYNIKAGLHPTSAYLQNLNLEKSDKDGADLLRGLVLDIFKKQNIDHKLATDSSGIDINTATPTEAKELIADDGYFGVEKTSERIFKFAVGIAGGDPSRIEAVRKGVENGFKEALGAFGGRLPGISYDTYDTVMKKLDNWAGVEKSPQSQI